MVCSGDDGGRLVVDAHLGGGRYQPWTVNIAQIMFKVLSNMSLKIVIDKEIDRLTVVFTKNIHN